MPMKPIQLLSSVIASSLFALRILQSHDLSDKTQHRVAVETMLALSLYASSPA